MLYLKTDISPFIHFLFLLKAKLSIGHHGERSLESFCQWQNEEYGGAKYLGNNQVPGARDDTPPVDAAVFVTRYGKIWLINLLQPVMPCGYLVKQKSKKKMLHLLLTCFR